MRARLYLAPALLCVTACSTHTLSASPQVQAGMQRAAVQFRITIPASVTPDGTRTPQYISTATSSVSVEAEQSGQQTVTANFPCSASVCSGTIDAPFGSDTFIVTLLSKSSKVLSEGQKTQTIGAGTNNVYVTFDPVVQTATLTIPPKETYPYLASIGPTSVKLDLTLTDPSGNTIIGPGMFLSPSNPSCVPTGSSPCVTIKLENTDTSGATLLSSSTFTSAQAALTTTLSIATADQNSPGKIPPFDDAKLTLTATGVPMLTGTEIPVSPSVTKATSPNGNVEGPGSGPMMNSVFGQYAFQADQYNASDRFYEFNPIIHSLLQDADTAVCCSNTSISSAGDHLLGGIPSPQSIVGTTSDSILYFIDESADAFSIADLTQQTAFNDAVQTPFTQPVLAAIVDPADHIWFAEADSSSNIEVEAFDATNPPASMPSPYTLPADQNGGTLVGLVNGPSGTVFAVVATSSDTYLNKLELGSGGAVTALRETKATPSLNLHLNSFDEPLPIAGYTHKDGFVYVADALGAITAINPSGGGTTAIALKSGVAAASADPNRLPMTLLPDKTLAYEGTSNDPVNGPFFYVHVYAGNHARAVSIAPAPSCTSQCVGQYWSISVDPNSGAIGTYTTDGGHTLASVW